MSSASLAVASRAHIAPRHLDPSRIAAISAALALNLAVLLIASQPLLPTQLSPFHAISPTPTIRFLDPPAVVPPPPPPIEMLPLTHPLATPTALIKSTPISVPVVTPTTDGMIAAPPVTLPTIVPGTTAPVTGTTSEPVEASLAYRASPLRFPTRALQQHMSGTVMLRVLVDETGKPLQVSVEHGSGYALLDRSATEQVMAGWRFQPAMVNGQAVRAWAKVPVTFELH